MNEITRPDPRDPTQLPPDDTDYTKKLDGKLARSKSRRPRVAFILRMGDHPLDIEVAAMVTRASKRFQELGTTVEEVEPPFPYDEASRIFLTHWLTNGQRLMQIFPESRHGEFDPSLLASMKAGQRYSMQDVVNAQVGRRELAVAWNLFFEKYDYLLTPSVAVQPFEVLKNFPEGPGGEPNRQWTPYTPIFNLTRHPAVSVPCGLSRQGLPVGLQIVAGHFRDAALLRAAACYSEAHPIEFPSLPEKKK